MHRISQPLSQNFNSKTCSQVSSIKTVKQFTSSSNHGQVDEYADWQTGWHALIIWCHIKFFPDIVGH